MSTTNNKDAWFPEPLILDIRGKLHFPNLIQPSTKFNENGSYEANIILPEEEAQQYIDKIDKFYEEMLQEARNEGVVKAKAKVKEATRGYSEHLDNETGEPTGNVVFKASRQATGTTSKGVDWEVQVPLFDSKGVPMTDLESVYGGTEAVVRVALTPFYTASLGFGLSANGKVPSSIRKGLLAVQIIKLVQGGNGAGEESFGAIEGGYEHTPNPSKETFSVANEEEEDAPETY